jgi:small subunit ribosomal protein S2
MVSEKAFATEAADIQPLEVSPEHIGEAGETEGAEAHAAAEPTQVAAADEDDETVDLAAVLGGNIRKAPAASEPESESEAISAQAAV